MRRRRPGDLAQAVLPHAVAVLSAAALSLWLGIATQHGTSFLALSAIVVLIVVEIAALVLGYILRKRRERVLEEDLCAQSRMNRLKEAERDSYERTRTSLEALNLPAGVVGSLHERISELSIPFDITPGKVTVATGELGIGKTTWAERIHRRQVLEAKTEGMPWPVFITARDLEDVPLRHAIAAAQPRKPELTFAVVIDECDLVGRDVAANILAQARVLVETTPGTSVAIMSRPGYIEARSNEIVTLPTLGAAEIDDIVQRVMGEMVAPSLAPTMQELAARPLFAILVGRRLRQSHGIPAKSVELLADLAEEVIRHSGVPYDTLFDELASLAELTTVSGGRAHEREVGTLAVREELIKTRFVVLERPYFRFATPFLEQYFAAQALLRETTDIDTQLASLDSWEKWRAAWAMALVTSRSRDMDSLLERLATRLPGAAAWLVSNTIRLRDSGAEEPSEAVDSSPSVTELSARLTTAMRRWCGSLQAVAEEVGVLPADGHWLHMAGFQRSKDFMVVGWSGDVTCDRLRVDRLRDLDYRSQNSVWHWAFGWRRPPMSPGWPWRYTLDVIAREVGDFIREKLRERPGVQSLQREQEWKLIKALCVNDLSLWLREGRKLTKVRDQLLLLIDQHLRHFEAPDLVSYTFGNRRMYEDELKALKETLSKDDGLDHLIEPWPGADRQPSDTQGWNGYSLPRLAERAAAVYNAALAGYDELTRRWFDPLRPTLSKAALMPLKMDGYVEVDGETACIYYSLLPLPHDSVNTVSLVLRHLDRDLDSELDNRREAFFRDLHYYRRGAASWVGFGQTLSRLEVFGKAPATSLAVSWLWKDLKRVGLAAGFPPPR